MGNPFCRTAAMSASDADEYQAADLGVRLDRCPPSGQAAEYGHQQSRDNA